MTIQVGDIVGDYRVIGLLGKGGMGRVYRVRSLLTDREDAMKVIAPDLDEHSDVAERFLREIKVHARLEHPNIAALHTALRVGDRIVMILELVDGVSLEERLHQGPLDTATAVAHIGEVLSALAYAHARGVIHRDIKPANILVTREGHVKLTDFGIARAAADHRLTLTGMALGSLYYMSPEQVRSAPVDARSDIYSVGATLYELVTGRHTTQATSEYAIMNAQLNEMPPPPVELAPGLSPALSEIIMRALAKAPEHRYQSAREFRLALEDRLQTAPTIALSPAVPQPAVPPPTLPPEDLARIERKLARAVGPIARRLVADAARRFATLPEIYQAVAAQIEAPADRAEFLNSCGTETPPAGTRVVTERVWDAALLGRLAQLLGAYLGPIAKVVVNRTAQAARSEDELVHALAAEIPSEADRARFLGALRNLSTLRSPSAGA